MGKTLVRDIRSVTVGTTSTLLLPERQGRLLTFVGAPPPLPIPASAFNNSIVGVSIATTGNKLGIGFPTGVTGRLTGWSWASVSTTAVLQLKYTRSGTIATVDQALANTWRPVSITAASPDSVNVFVTTAGLGGEVADITIAMETYSAGPRISLGFGAAAVLDQGLTVYAGQLPFILPGPALDVDIFGVADAAGRTVNVIDLFYA